MPANLISHIHILGTQNLKNGAWTQTFTKKVKIMKSGFLG